MRKTRYILLAVICTLIACATDDLSPTAPSENVAVALQMTRATSDGIPLGKRTYRVLLFDHTTHKYKHLKGAYYDDDGTKAMSGLLKPALVNENGQLLASASPEVLLANPDDFVPQPVEGLFAPTGYYDMVLVTPAIMPKQTSALLDNWGIYYPRYEKVTGSMYVSKYIRVYLRSRGEVYNNKQYDTLQVNLGNREQTLTEPRSRIRFNLSCAGTVQESKIARVRLTNLIDKAWYDPGQADFYMELGNNGVDYVKADPITLSPPEITESTPKTLTLGDEPWELPVKGSDIDETEGNGYIHVLSQKYSTPGAYDGSKKYPIFNLEIERDDDIAVFPLDFDMRPHYNYTFDIKIESQVVHVSLTVEPWEDGSGVNTNGGVGSDIDNPPLTGLRIYVDPWVSKTLYSDIDNK